MGTFSAVDLFNRVGDRISTVGDSFSIVDGIQYVGGTQYCGGYSYKT